MEQPKPFSFTHHTSTFDVRDRARAAGIHFGLSLAVAALAALLVFGLWYPYPYSHISGGRGLFALVVTVDVVLGPAITFAIFDRSKGWRLLRMDFLVVGLLQLAGLAYGLYTVQLARPVHMVFEYDRFRIVHAVELPPSLLDRSPPGIEPMPLKGPTLIALRPFRDQNERTEATLSALRGIPLSARPDLWQDYEKSRAAVLLASRPVAELRTRFAARAGEIDNTLQGLGRTPANTRYLPMVARAAQGWTVFLDAATAEVLGYLPLDSF
jgi:hypothetical protein